MSERKVSRRSFERILTIRLLVFMVVLFAIFSVADYWYVRTKLIEDKTSRLVEHMSQMATALNDSTKNAALILKNNLPYLDLHDTSFEHLCMVPHRIIDDSPGLLGSAVALLPESHEGRKRMVYVYRDEDDGTMLAKDMDTQVYDYCNMQWFYVALDKPRGCWSEPYFDKFASDFLMCTFSHPITDARKRVTGILTVDVSLKTIRRQTEALKPFKSDKCFAELVTAKGTYIESAHELWSGYENIHEKSQFDQKTVERIMGEKEGILNVILNGERYTVLHTRVEEPGWKIILAFPTQMALQDLQEVTRNLAIFGVLLIVSVVVLVYLNIRKVLRPLSVFNESVKTLATGKLDTPLPDVAHVGEIVTLRNSMEYMRTSLCTHIEQMKEMTARNERMENELRIASAIQESLLPESHPHFEGRDDLDLYAALTPAKEVGGDLYDYHLRNDRLFFIIGDVSGKSVPASLLMAVACGMFRTLSQLKDDPGEIVSLMNDSICSNNPRNMFITMVVGMLNLKTGEIVLCNAGHNLPIALCPHSNDYLHLHTNIAVGVIQGYKYVCNKYVMGNGHALLLYTDGVTEAINSEHSQYGTERLKQTALANAQRECSEIGTAIRESVLSFAHGTAQSDDIAVLIVRYKGKGKDHVLTLTNDMNELEKLEPFVHDLDTRYALGRKFAAQLRLALEEALVNIIKYAYADTHIHYIYICTASNGTTLTLTVVDDGQPFNPLESNKADTDSPLEERPIGGLGILLMRRLADSMDYKRTREGCNVLTLTKRYKETE